MIFFHISLEQEAIKNKFCTGSHFHIYPLCPCLPCDTMEEAMTVFPFHSQTSSYSLNPFPFMCVTTFTEKLSLPLPYLCFILTNFSHCYEHALKFPILKKKKILRSYHSYYHQRIGGSQERHSQH